MTTIQVPPPDVELRQAAITRLRRKRDLQGHVIAYVTVNLTLIGIWFLSGPSGFFWPMIPMLVWGIGVVFNVWDLYSPAQPSEADVRKEMQHIRSAR